MKAAPLALTPEERSRAALRAELNEHGAGRYDPELEQRIFHPDHDCPLHGLAMALAAIKAGEADVK